MQILQSSSSFDPLNIPHITDVTIPWPARASSAPITERAAVLNQDGYGYFLGGIGAIQFAIIYHCKIIADGLFKLDPHNGNQVSVMAKMNNPIRGGVAMTNLGYGQLLACGGWGINTCEVFNGQSWQHAAPLPAPITYWQEGAMCTLQGVPYAFGGHISKTSVTQDVYALKQNKWVKMVSMLNIS